MSIISFFKDAGEKLFGAAHAAPPQADPEAIAAANRAAATAIEGYIASTGLTATGLTVTYDGASATAKVFGIASDQATKEKIILAAGNVRGIAAVDDNMTVDLSQPESTFYTVVSGDTLSKIAKHYYGDANKYPRIFEANREVIKDANLIFPGQKIRIPLD